MTGPHRSKARRQYLRLPFYRGGIAGPERRRTAAAGPQGGWRPALLRDHESPRRGTGVDRIAATREPNRRSVRTPPERPHVGSAEGDFHAPAVAPLPPRTPRRGTARAASSPEAIIGYHGWLHIAGGLDGFGGFIATLGVPAPTLVAYLVTGLELAGGILLAVGGLTRSSPSCWPWR
ncbi:MAG: DoxX family protein [Euzebyaceae bacterium]|nr:DoxX family protein [Euzebyaceae bacterium]